MQFRQFNLGGTLQSAGVGCGGLLFLLGLILISPVGKWLITSIGWLFVLIGIFSIVTGIYYWIKSSSKVGSI